MRPNAHRSLHLLRVAAPSLPSVTDSAENGKSRSVTPSLRERRRHLRPELAGSSMKGSSMKVFKSYRISSLFLSYFYSRIFVLSLSFSLSLSLSLSK